MPLLPSASPPLLTPRRVLLPAGGPAPGPAPLLASAVLGEGSKRDVPVTLLKRPTEGQRIAALPVVDYWHPEVVAAAQVWCTENWLRPGAKRRFLDTQAIALFAAALEGGMAGQAAVGVGKTLLSFLIAEAMGAQRPVLFIPASVRLKTEREWQDYNLDFKLPRNVHRMAYEELSTARNTDWLEHYLPDCLVLDEAHKLRNLDSARARRVDRYMEKYPGTRVAVMSGTLTSTTIADYAHFMRWCLKHQAVTPKESGALQSFRIILDVKAVKPQDDGDGGTVYSAVHAPGNQNWTDFAPLWPGWSATGPDERQAEARKVWSRRLASAPGVIVTTDPGTPCALIFREHRVATPQRVLDALQKLETTWCRDDEEELSDAKDLHRVAIQMSQGFYYRWVWPNGVVDEEWLAARSAWHSVVRQICKRSIPHCDSALLVGRQVASGAIKALCANLADEALSARAEWAKHEHKRWGGLPHPPTETVWLDTFLADAAEAWLKKHPHGLVWYEHGAMARELASRGIPVFGAGMSPQDDGVGKALSIKAHGTGKNLQTRHHENLCLCFPTSGEQAEQLIGRTHRQGQTAEEVIFEYLQHVGPAKRALDQAKLKATYMRDSTSTPQKLLYGTWE